LIRVAFLLGALDKGWLGGVNYYASLIYALNSLENRNIQPIIVTGKKPSASLVEAIGEVEILKTSLLDRNSISWLCAKSLRAILGSDFLLERYLSNQRIQIVSHAPFIGKNRKVPTIGWIPDFQYKYLPGFFSEAEVNNRDSSNDKICRYSDALIVSSNAAKKDLMEFAPFIDPSIVVVLPFTSGIRPGQILPTVESLKEKYHLGNQYFLLPNQFWMHKNHKVVLRAIAHLKQQGQEISILFTGNNQDPRNPYYFDELISYASELGVKEDFNFLGITPYEDLLGLMSHAVAVINPSFFEGWSSSVEEAKALGKQLVLSDIPVHREQVKDRALFFKPDDHVALAEALNSMWHNFEPLHEAAYTGKALDGAVDRWQAYGVSYQQIIGRLVSRSE